MFAVDAERTGESDRHLHGADEVLDVARIALRLLQRARVGEFGARCRRKSRQRPAAVEGFARNLAAARNARRRRIVPRRQACGLFESARAARDTQIIENATVMAGQTGKW
jgi:hypothetical protein